MWLPCLTCSMDLQTVPQKKLKIYFFTIFTLGTLPPFVYKFIYFLWQYYCLLHFGVKASRANTSAITYYPLKKCQWNSTPLTDRKLRMILTQKPRQPLLAPDVTYTLCETRILSHCFLCIISIVKIGRTISSSKLIYWLEQSISEAIKFR